ncbi:hypothetical protein ABT167_05585 [Streptomyces sp. NPDC001792]|uniref:hypothetical protein n=1 Tax=Streptomyces sp. NPDC001792 TaxID=3154524 RepID=UPI00332858B8
MDEGLAALIAGGFGLIGALAATGGAMWGARKGAASTLETARAQVAGQERAEHRHWAREQRMPTLMDALDQLATIDRTLGAAGVKLALGERPPTELHDDYMTSSEALMRAVFRLGVWGPDQARIVGQKIHDLANRVYQSWVLCDGAMVAERSTDSHQDAFQSRRTELHAPWAEFLNIAARVLREPEEAA